ncbi:UNVERIFIED_CONTAM: Serine/threonine-protein phosphatase 7 long form [Sesamum angustifolium]|uniref:Serine/threonine-protein phosphatase 7 long form n=1 Tax=Sesamum angustifolium TaxID=2727405 RepID=A0AAW2RMU8_9LAMI
MDRRAVYGPRDGTVLSQQSQHRSDEILDGDIDEVLQAKRADGKFWRNLREQDLPIRVQQILHQIGFYGVYRCGRIQYDCHLITALVERWRSETHTFHFRVGEATITLQDVQVIWGLPIDGEPVSGTDLERTSVQWQEYCMQYIGFAPEEGALKGSRLQVKAIIEHISHVHITPDTPHLTVVQYARAVALLLLGGTMCPDSSGNLVSLLYLAKLEDIVAARNYSWGSAVLAFLYRELCNASEKGKAAIGGALQLVQIWAWSRIIPLCPGLVRTTVRVIRDILDEMQHDQFIWQPYDMESNVIMAYAGDFNPQLWRSICPLIFYAIVEMHHPERVLRQFGMMQNIPDQPDTRDMSLHRITRSNRTGTDWVCSTYSISLDGKDDMTRSYKDNPFPTEEIQIEDIGNVLPPHPTDKGEVLAKCLLVQLNVVILGWIAGPSTAYTPQDYYVPQPPQDYYVPQPSQDDWFQSTSYMPSHAEAYSSHVDLDLGLGFNQPYAPEYNISPVPFPSFSAYRDNVESSSAASSSGLHI